ncbi:MAG: holo-[acyl-carrier-protein] synthase [Ignavibacteria bacterium RIFOXYB2_FULL_35_12]|nr:MAG: holo-[acyl-carrier-protein] synthase [Ignavibacteria bacterium GWA2_36_19]OGU57953.1 MAG: holo-[acyl-carrier-protein] synthase [Ignavibacteria bacterium GWF2_35_20]OGU79500.1 MAG: holo-[acyl-carrier-protein] synthase [Ignavibacteria bacterium RIFOXYA2_FULL_35_9]OGU81794.1 MAG: holo-[acyl-carrier-protein] synthase [Ignavibacteria bacterium RBG_16_35_7]OGU90482.1 MAG: holo-[acyl-carrier-protein] synthase [Ignavibacteria bacterium RIFOXYC12_FULL_35_11]OGU91903.1 MAG: holo-[acyl-carrier-pr
MVIGIGIDIIEIDRIKESIEKFGDRFLNKIYTQKELDYCLKKNNKYQHLAARFAAKEAVYKALATGWDADVSWQNIEISNEPNGMPIVTLQGKLKKFLHKGKDLKISMSHSRDYVACMAIVYKSDSDK